MGKKTTESRSVVRDDRCILKQTHGVELTFNDVDTPSRIVSTSIRDLDVMSLLDRVEINKQLHMHYI